MSEMGLREDVDACIDTTLERGEDGAVCDGDSERYREVGRLLREPETEGVTGTVFCRAGDGETGGF